MGDARLRARAPAFINGGGAGESASDVFEGIMCPRNGARPDDAPPAVAHGPDARQALLLRGDASEVRATRRFDFSGWQFPLSHCGSRLSGVFALNKCCLPKPAAAPPLVDGRGGPHAIACYSAPRAAEAPTLLQTVSSHQRASRSTSGGATRARSSGATASRIGGGAYNAYVGGGPAAFEQIRP